MAGMVGVMRLRPEHVALLRVRTHVRTVLNSSEFRHCTVISGRFADEPRGGSPRMGRAVIAFII